VDEWERSTPGSKKGYQKGDAASALTTSPRNRQKLYSSNGTTISDPPTNRIDEKGMLSEGLSLEKMGYGLRERCFSSVLCVPKPGP